MGGYHRGNFNQGESNASCRKQRWTQVSKEDYDENDEEKFDQNHQEDAEEEGQTCVKVIELTDSCGDTIIVNAEEEEGIRVIRADAIVVWRPDAQLLLDAVIEYSSGNNVFVKETVSEIRDLIAQAV